MKIIRGKPLIGYLFERAKCLSKVDKIILATSTDKRNLPMCGYAESLGFEVFKGSEDDVLDRYYQVARRHNADHIVRLTGDCPLIDTMICDQLVEMYLKESLGYARLSPRFAEGLDCEILSIGYLSTAWKEAREKSEREHVTLYINNHPHRFDKKVMDHEADDSKYRITVDEPEDFEVVRAIIEALYQDGERPFGFTEIKNFLDRHPDIYKKNSHIIRNQGLLISLANDKKQPQISKRMTFDR